MNKLFKGTLIGFIISTILFIFYLLFTGVNFFSIDYKGAILKVIFFYLYLPVILLSIFFVFLFTKVKAPEQTTKFRLVSGSIVIGIILGIVGIFVTLFLLLFFAGGIWGLMGNKNTGILLLVIFIIAVAVLTAIGSWVVWLFNSKKRSPQPLSNSPAL